MNGRRSVGVGLKRKSEARRDSASSSSDDRETEDEERKRKKVALDRQRRVEMYGATAGGSRAGTVAVAAAAAAGRVPQQLGAKKIVGVPASVMEDIKNSWAGIMQKASENKINAKNAWQVSQFDSLPVLARELGRDRDFHTSGVTIESAAVVLAYKVDALLLQSARVQSAITRGTIEDEPAADDANAPDAGDGAGRQQRKRRQVSNAVTIADPADINIKSCEKQSDVDPLFARTSSRFDQGGASGLLLLNCPIGPNINVMLDSSSADMQPPLTADKPDAPMAPRDYGEEVAFSDEESEGGTAARDSAAAAAAAAAADVEGAVLRPPADGGAPAAGDLADQPTNAEELFAAAVENDAFAAPEFDGDDDERHEDPDADFFADDGGEAFGMPENLESGLLPADAAAPEPVAAKTAAERAEETAVDQRLQLLDELPADEQLRAVLPNVLRGTMVDEALNLEEDEEAEVLEMHSAVPKKNAHWQGPSDSARWKSQPCGGPAAPAARRKKAVADLIQLPGVGDPDAKAVPLTDDELAGRLAPVEAPAALLQLRGRARRKWAANRRLQEQAGVAPTQVFVDNFFDMERWIADASANKIMLPDDFSVTTDHFFKLNCLPEWTMIKKQPKIQEAIREQLKKEEEEAKAYRTSAPVLDDEGAEADGTVQESPLESQPVITLRGDPGAQTNPFETSAGEWGDLPAAMDFDHDDARSSQPGTPTRPHDSQPVPPNAPHGSQVFSQDSGEFSQPRPLPIPPRESLDLSTDLQVVDRPDELKLINIQHAKKAKVVDIKKLKDTMWECLGRGVSEDGKVVPILFSKLIGSMQALVAQRKIANHVYEACPFFVLATCNV
ncbi:Condensin complex subunit 2 [Diplonema papillatum]|nr:Condensin complex subunit 2 [Diplonema papillatum]